jgi:hypothetical protein
MNATPKISGMLVPFVSSYAVVHAANLNLVSADAFGSGILFRATPAVVVVAAVAVPIPRMVTATDAALV